VLWSLPHNFIRLGQMRAKALQTVSGFQRETARHYATKITNAFILGGNRFDLIIIKNRNYLTRRQDNMIFKQ
jgi:hypothetical protein